MDKDEKIKSEKEREERIHEENLKKKREKEDHLTIKTQTEISQEKAPNKNKNIEKETQIEYSPKYRRELKASFIRIMQKIISAIKMTKEDNEKYIYFLREILPILM